MMARDKEAKPRVAAHVVRAAGIIYMSLDSSPASIPDRMSKECSPWAVVSFRPIVMRQQLWSGMALE